MRILKPNVTTKRIEEIERIQAELRKLAEEYEKDFDERIALAPVIEKDLHSAIENLDLLKNLYKSKTERKRHKMIALPPKLSRV